MKRALSLICLLALLFFVVQWTVTHFEKKHEVNYKIVASKKEFSIYERYEKNLGDNYYLEIKQGNHKFNYTINNKFNKRKNIIDNLIFIEEDNTLCIYPKLVNDEEKLNIECSKDNKTYSYESMKNNKLVISLIEKLKAEKESLPAWEIQSEEETKANTSTTYNKNILPEDYITVWNYKGLEIITNKENIYTVLSIYDKYENTHGLLVDKYYLLPLYRSNRVYDFDSLNILNLETNEQKIMTLDRTFNQDTYINGVVDNKAYYFDKDNSVQISIDPKKQDKRIVGNKDINTQYYNGKWNTVNIYDFINEKKVFKFDYSVIKELTSKNPVEVFDTLSSYYYFTTDGSFYRLSKTNLDTPILLFKQANMKEIKVIKDTIYFVVGDTLYYYHDNYGIRKIVKNQEWNYNLTNIIDIYKKPI